MQWLLLILTVPYIYLILKIYISLLKIREYDPQKPSDIFVSLIVACKNEEGNIHSLLSCLADQDYDPDLFEVIIVDDNSADKTFHIASAFTGIKNLKIISNQGYGKKKALKTGVQECSGELVLMTDADCIPGRKWVRTIASFYSLNKPDMITGPVLMEGSRGFLQRFQELEFLSLQGVTAGTAMAGNPVMCNGANLAFLKEVFINNAAGLREDEVSGDDVFLLHSIKKAEGSITWLGSLDATVTTRSMGNWRSFLGQRARWISKTRSYQDSYTLLLAIVTFVTILIQVLLLIAGVFNKAFLPVFVGVFFLKSIPDYLIIKNTASRYGKKHLMRWFIPSQILYPFYILRIVVGSMFTSGRWK